MVEHASHPSVWVTDVEVWEFGANLSFKVRTYLKGKKKTNMLQNSQPWALRMLEN